jgi:hypothetical protein
MSTNEDVKVLAGKNIPRAPLPEDANLSVRIIRTSHA